MARGPPDRYISRQSFTLPLHLSCALSTFPRTTLSEPSATDSTHVDLQYHIMEESPTFSSPGGGLSHPGSPVQVSPAIKVSSEKPDWFPTGKIEGLVLTGSEMPGYIACYQASADALKRQIALNSSSYTESDVERFTGDMQANYKEINEQFPEAEMVWLKTTKALKEEWSKITDHWSEDGKEGDAAKRSYTDTEFDVGIDFDKYTATINAKIRQKTASAESKVGGSPETVNGEVASGLSGERSDALRSLTPGQSSIGGRRPSVFSVFSVSSRGDFLSDANGPNDDQTGEERNAGTPHSSTKGSTLLRPLSPGSGSASTSPFDGLRTKVSGYFPWSGPNSRRPSLCPPEDP